MAKVSNPAFPTATPFRHAVRRAARAAPGVPRLWHFAVEYLLLLPFGAAVGFAWANLWPESYFRTAFTLDFFVTDVAMVLFFGLMAKEVVEATAPGGVLHPWRRAALPFVAAIGATVVPLMLIGVAPVFGEPPVMQGWAVTTAIDLAIGYFMVLAIFGRHPIVPFFILLALSANALGFLLLAPAAASAGVQWVPFLVLMTGAIGVALLLRWRRTVSFWPYVVVAGGLSWLALLFGGIRPALALLPIVPFIPHAARDPGFLVDAPDGAHDPLNEFEHWFRHPAQAALLLFGFITGGVLWRALDWGTLALPLVMLIGKPIGVLAGIAAGRALGLHFPFHVDWRHASVVAILATAGFTMMLFFAAIAIGPGAVLSEIKAGALLTLVGLPLALAAARLLRVGKFARAGR
jgi:NhaA family Na+:H+ antiporter